MATTKVAVNMEQAINEFVRKKAAEEFDGYAAELIDQFREKLYAERDAIISSIAIKMTRAAKATGKTDIIIRVEEL